MTLEFINLSELKDKIDILLNRDMKSACLFSNYYKEYYQDKYIDLSFLLINNGEEIGYVLCSSLENKLTLPDGGIIIVLKPNTPKHNHKKIYSQIVERLHFQANAYGCNTIVIKDNLPNGNQSILGEILFNQRFKSRLTFEMSIDFADFHQDKFHASLRKSYKSLISWGKRELKTIHINQDNLDYDYFQQFKAFHHKISGRQTRSDLSWKLQYKMIEEGVGELVLAKYSDQIIAGSLFADYADTSIYFTGVYERDLFEFGVSHFLVYEGISSAYRRNFTSMFSLGYFDTDIEDPKWYNIQFFKKGFCDSLIPIVFWSKEIP